MSKKPPAVVVAAASPSDALASRRRRRPMRPPRTPWRRQPRRRRPRRLHRPRQSRKRPPRPIPARELDTAARRIVETDRTPTAQARVLYAKAELAKLRRQPAEQERNLLTIAAKFKPDILPATILGQVGDALLSKGKLDQAAPYYQFLMETYPKNDNVDFAYAGLGEIAFQKKQYQKALEYFKDGTDKIAANLKLKDLTVGQGKALLALGKYDEAKKIFESSAAVREWRGETTAFCVYSLGEIEEKQGHWAEANAYYQRVYVAYQRFLPWVAKAYLGSAGSFRKARQKRRGGEDVPGDVA